MKLLIDECLSPELAKLAHELGHGEFSHVVWLKKSGWKDWQLKSIILDGDWTFVTRDAIDFRGPDAQRGSKGQYADVHIHAGLICLDAAGGMDLDMQLRLLKEALKEVGDE
jgi:predicted nuclease of predicted toxin-antitoxin system